MSTIKLKWSMHLAGRYIEAGTQVELLDLNDQRIQQKWPNIKESSISTQVAVKFDFLPHPTFLHISQIQTI